MMNFKVLLNDITWTITHSLLVECSQSVKMCPEYTQMSPHEVNEIHMPFH
jgi:hypothetical protein